MSGPTYFERIEALEQFALRSIERSDDLFERTDDLMEVLLVLIKCMGPYIKTAEAQAAIQGLLAKIQSRSAAPGAT